MEIIEEKNCLVLKNSISSDLLITIKVMDKKIKVDKWVLLSESDYFKAMFNNEWIETNTNCIAIKEKGIKPLINVLKIAFGLQINDKECNYIEVEELNESLIIANKYQFNRVEKILSNQLMAKFTAIHEMSSQTFQTFLDIYQMSENKNLKFLRDLWLNFIDENADEMLQKFDELSISHEMLFQIIDRNSFGVQEIHLFKALMNWITKTRLKLSYDFYEEEELLLKAIRFQFISKEDIQNSVKPSLQQLFIPLFNDSIIESQINDFFDCNLNKSHRMSVQTEKFFTVKTDKTIHTSYEFNDENEDQELLPIHELPFNQIRTYSNCVVYTFNLQLMSKINCIKFKIMPNNNSRSNWDRSLMSYIIEVQETDSNAQKIWKKVIDYRHEKCIGLQELYFEECITNSIRIVHKSIEELFKIHSISLKYTKNPLKLFNNTCVVQPLNEMTVINGMECLIAIGSKERNITYHILRDFEHNAIVKDLVHKMDRNEDLKTNYYIKFAQPFAIDCFQLTLKQENHNSFVKYNTVIEVSIARELSFNHSENIWVKVAEESVKVEESVTCNVEFELQIVSMIKICCDLVSDIPLVMSGVRVPADHSSDHWINGKTLSYCCTNS